MPITETVFKPRRYLTLKKSIATSQISDKQMYDDAGKKLSAYIERYGLNHKGGWSVLYFNWDEAKGKTDIGIAFPMIDLNSVQDSELTIVDIPESEASIDTLRGPYEGLSAIHQSLMQYMIDKKYDTAGIPVMAIEEYIVDPMSDPNPENWVTNIYYLHK